MNAATPPDTLITHTNYPIRRWYARLDLEFTYKPKSNNSKHTALTRAGHQGPLRVQRPFYPEADGCCHVYLLHPPGGVVIGDELKINALVKENAQALITTPSAGRIYGAKGQEPLQQQNVILEVEDGAYLEWLPQETILFEGANGKLTTRVDLHPNANVLLWDVVRLGRRASGEAFKEGRCQQSLELWREQTPLFIERNDFQGHSDLMHAPWGLQGASTSGTLIATLNASRDQIDQWVEMLDALSETPKFKAHGLNRWGLTQKEDVFIARFLGHSMSLCREGMIMLWQQLRPLINKKEAVIPRIWNT